MKCFRNAQGDPITVSDEMWTLIKLHNQKFELYEPDQSEPQRTVSTKQTEPKVIVSDFNKLETLKEEKSHDSSRVKLRRKPKAGR